jgi:TonB family protein
MPQSPVRAIGILSLLFASSAFAQFKTPSPSASIEQAAHASAANASAANAKQTPPPKEPQYSSSKFVVLTDTKGYNLGPYLDNIFSIVRNEWLAAGDQVVKKPKYRRGTVAAEFIIARSGEIHNLKITEPSGEDDLDKAVTQALEKASPLPELPKGLTSQQLEMRFRFFYDGKNPPRWWQR